MATQTIDATLFASSHPDIAKRTSVSGLIISVGMMLVGILIFASIFEMSDKSSTLSMGLMVLGTALILLGVFRLLRQFRRKSLSITNLNGTQAILWQLTIRTKPMNAPR